MSISLFRFLKITCYTESSLTVLLDISCRDHQLFSMGTVSGYFKTKQFIYHGSPAVLIKHHLPQVMYISHILCIQEIVILCIPRNRHFQYVILKVLVWNRSIYCFAIKRRATLSIIKYSLVTVLPQCPCIDAKRFSDLISPGQRRLVLSIAKDRFDVIVSILRLP